MEISFSLPSCMTSGVCTSCGGCGSSSGKVNGPYNSEYDASKAGNVAKLIWEDGGVATFFTNGKIKTSAIVTYTLVSSSFQTDFNSPTAEKDWGRNWGFTGKMLDLTEIQKDAIRATAKHIMDNTGLTLVEVSDINQADIKWRSAEFNGNPGINPGVMNSFDGRIKNAGTIFFNSFYQNYSETVNYAPGERGFSDMLHEWGHMIGLKHAFFGNNRLTINEDNRQNTVMSHIEAPNGLYNSSLTKLDVAALQYIYGTPDERSAKGISYSQLGYDGLISRADNGGRHVVGIDGAKDRMYGGGGNDVLEGLAGDDWISAGGGNNIINGGIGQDVVAWSDISLQEVKSGSAKLSIWKQDAQGKSWSGILVRADGKFDIFSNIEILYFGKEAINLELTSLTSAKAGLERLFMMAFKQNSTASSFAGHLIRLENGSITLEGMAKDFIESRWFKSPANWTTLSVGEKVGELWSRVFVGTKIPDSLKNWSNITGDFYGAVNSIISIDDYKTFVDFDKSSQVLNINPSRQFLCEGYFTQPDTSTVIGEAFEVIFGRSASSVEIAEAINRRDWHGVSYSAIFEDMFQSSEFRDLILNKNPKLGAIKAILEIQNPDIDLNPDTLSRLILDKLKIDADNQDYFDLSVRNGSYGFTLGSELKENDTVASYSYMKEVKFVTFKNGKIYITNNYGVDVRVPDSVSKIEFFDGTLFVQGIDNRNFLNSLSEAFSTPETRKMSSFSILDMSNIPIDRSSSVDDLFKNEAFLVKFSAYFSNIRLSEQIQSLYRTMLDRDPTTGERSSADLYMSSGGNLAGWANIVAKSNEMTNRYTPDTSGVRVFDSYQAAAIKIYEVLLGRTDNWAAEHLKAGYEIRDIVDSVLKSNEFINVRLRGSLSNEEFARLVFRGTYDREISEPVVAAWSSALDQGYGRVDLVVDAISDFVRNIAGAHQISVLSTNANGFEWDFDNNLKAAVETLVSPNLPNVSMPAFSIEGIVTVRPEGMAGSTGFKYAVTRDGDLSTTASVAWNVSGFGDQSGTSADFAAGVLPSGRIQFAPGQARVELLVEVKGDLAVEPDEGFLVSLSAPTAEMTISRSIASGVILNDDLSPVSSVLIEGAGAVHLYQSDERYTLTTTDASVFVRFNGNPVTANPASGWKPIAVEATSSGYQVAWKLTGADKYSVWNTDSNGNFTSYATSILSGASFAIQTFETSFQQDLNSDGQIGPRAVALESRGATHLTQVADQYALRGSTSAAGPSLKYDGTEVTIGRSDGWSPIAAEATASGYQVAWKLTGADKYSVWNTDSNGNFTSCATPVLSGASFAIQTFETSFQQDLNSDGQIGPRAVALESRGATHLTQVADQYALRGSTSAAGPSLKYDGTEVTIGRSDGWSPIAAEATASGYQVAWKLTGADKYSVWNTDSNGNFTSCATPVLSGASFAIQTFETSFQQDLNSDGQIGPRAVALESRGATHLTQVADQYALRGSTSAAGPSLKYDGTEVTIGRSDGWSPIAAEATASGYQVAWKLTGADKYSVWNTDSNGNFTSCATPVLSGASFAIQTFETSFQQDLNSDGQIGPRAVALESRGATHLTQVADQYALRGSTSAAGPSLKYDGTEVTIGRSDGWSPIAAEATASGYQVAWKLTGADKYSVWNTDSNGNFTSCATPVLSGASFAIQTFETSFQQDLNSDGQIGPRAVALESRGATHLTQVADQYALRGSTSAAGPSLKYDGTEVTIGRSDGWSPIAAEATASGYQVAWKLTGADKYSVWNTDSNGNFTSCATPVLSGASFAIQTFETSFQQDLNSDGQISIWGG